MSRPEANSSSTNFAGSRSGTMQSSTPNSIQSAMLESRSTRRLLTTALVDGSTSEQSTPATHGATAAAAETRAQLTGRSSRKLIISQAADADADWQEQNTPTGFRTMLTGKSYCKLPTEPAVDDDSEGLGSHSKVVTLAQQPWQETYPGSPARNYRAQMSGKSCRNLTPARDSASSACTQASQLSQIFDLSTSTSATRSKLAGNSSRRLLLGASCTRPEWEDNTPCAPDGGPATAVIRNTFAGKSSRKLLRVLSEVATPMAGRATTCDTMLSGRSSRKLSCSAAGLTGLHSPALTPAATTRSLGLPNSAMLLSRPSGKVSSPTRAVHQQASCSTQTPQLGADSLADRSCSQRSTNMHHSSKALLGSRSSRRLLGLAALAHPQLLDSEQLSALHLDDDGGLADAVVHIKFREPSLDASKALALGKPFDNTPVAYATVSVEQRAKVDSLALLLSNAAEKDVLLDAMVELQGLAAGSVTGSPAVKLAIGQHPDVAQGLGDLLDDSDLDLQCAAVSLICDLASGVPENRSVLGTNSGLVNGLRQLVYNGDKAVRANAARALGAVAADSLTVQAKITCHEGHKIVGEHCHHIGSKNA